ncbi:MAG: carbohydrate-binding family 9-like protein [bacterium]
MIKLFIGILIIFYSQNSQIGDQVSESKSSEIREYRVERVQDTISIDGKLNEPEWQDTAFTEDFVVHTNGAEPELATKAQMLWDDKNLYIAFTVSDNQIWATMKNHDQPLWLEEAVEVFIDPDGDGKNYIELQANCLGTTLDLLMNKEFAKGGHTNYRWNLKGFTVGIDTVTYTEKNCNKWICEMALPFKSILSLAPTMNCPPAVGDRWRINVCRIERDPSHRDSLEATCWNQTDSRGFHAPDKFGRIIFMDTDEKK